MSSPTEDEARLVIGTVEEVSPARIVVSLDLDAPEATALVQGRPVAFPRISGYVVIRTEVGVMVGLSSWLGIERAAYPKRLGLKDFGLIDLPFPSRRMHVTPLGTLGVQDGRLQRGTAAFPSVGDPVRLPTPAELQRLMEQEPPNDRVRIGRSAVVRTADVTVDPDRIFGRHLAILGNTGSGKSCSTAGLIRWSVEAAQASTGRPARARFIILDPNGEYRNTFSDLDMPTRVLQVPPPEAPAQPLKVPAWFWNSFEWVSFVQASPGAQRPVLVQALRDLRSGGGAAPDDTSKLARNLHGYRAMLRNAIQSGPQAFGQFPGSQNCKRALEGVVAVTNDYGDAIDDLAAEQALEHLTGTAQTLLSSKGQYDGFVQSELDAVVEALDGAYGALPAATLLPAAGEDAPITFDVTQLVEHIEFLAEVHPSFKDTARYLGSLTMRIATLLGNSRVLELIGPTASEPLDEWLEGYLDGEGAITVVDLSLVPSELVQLVVGVVSRVLFEALQRRRRKLGTSLPTVLVLEEAHNFVARRGPFDETAGAPQDHCLATFERIAREGRKFGCSLVISSQRPAELSETVLAQCNTFLLHRLVNDRDQQLVRRLVPDALGGLLDELPALPARHAVLLGWATTLPTVVEMRELEPAFRPHAADPGYWDSWTSESAVETNWPAVVADWTEP